MDSLVNLITQLSLSLSHPSFWSQQLYFLLIFISLILLASLPLYLLLQKFRSPLIHPLLIPIFGLINLLCLLLAADTISLFLPPTQPYYFLSLTPLLWLFELLLIAIIHHKRAQKPSSSFKRSSIILPIIIYLAVYAVITSLHFDPVSGQFFTPGIELNHDVMNIQSAVIHLQRDVLVSPNNLAGKQGGLTLNIYPRGGTVLTYFITSLLNTDVFTAYSRILTATFSLTIFLVAYILDQFKRTTTSELILSLIYFSTIINYLTLSFINTSVTASTLLTPLLLFSLYLLYYWLKHDRSYSNGLMLTLTLLAGVYLYTYVILVFYLITGLIVMLHLGSDRSRLLKLILPLLLVFGNPINLNNAWNLLTTQLASTNPETNLFMGMHGNLSGFLNPFMYLSWWISHPNYIIGGIRTGNSWMIALLVFIVIAFLKIAKPEKKPASQSSLKYLFIPYGIILLATFATRSPYQQAKVMQLSAPFLPLFIYAFFQPYLNSSHQFKLVKIKLHQRILTRGLLSLIFLTMIGSGLYAASHIGKPVLASYQELIELELSLCADPSNSIMVIGRDEWARNHLFSCQNIHYFFDRYDGGWNDLVAFNQENQRLHISEPCEPNSLTYSQFPQFNYDYLLIDHCIDYYPEGYKLYSEGSVYRIFKLIIQIDADPT